MRTALPSWSLAASFGVVGVFASAAVGCQHEPPPKGVHLELPEVVMNRDVIRPVVRVRRGGGSSAAAPGSFSLRAEPSSVAVAGADGTLACAKSGDAKVTADVQGIQSQAVLRCRLVERLEVAELPLLDLRKGAVTLAARALAKDGKELSDVPISVSSTNPEAVRVRGMELTPVAVGNTDFVVRAGSVERRLTTRVVRGLDVEALPLHGGRRVDITLPAGKYELEVTLKEAKPLSIDWRGARACNYRGTGVTHRSVCLLETKGGAVVDNPAFVESGDTTLAKERIVVREVP